MDVIKKEMNWEQVFWLLVRRCQQCKLVMKLCCQCLLQGRSSTHRYFFLRYNNRTVLPPDCYWCEPTLVYGLESIFCKEETSHECEGINDKNWTPWPWPSVKTTEHWLLISGWKCVCVTWRFFDGISVKVYIRAFDIYCYWTHFAFFLTDFYQMASTNVTFIST